jgi:hypothetical protein
MNEGNGKVDLTKLIEPFHASAIQTRPAPGGGKPLEYVAGQTYIRRVIDATGNQFDLAVRDVAYREIGVDARGNPVVLQTIRVALTIPGLGTREGVGVQVLRVGGGEDLEKGALTDGFKNAAKYFGLGLDLYGPDYEGVEEDARVPPRAEAGRRDAPRAAPPPLPLDDDEERNEEWASEEQLRAIKRLWERLYPGKPIERRLAIDFQVPATDDLTVADAARFIKALNKELTLVQRAGMATA